MTNETKNIAKSLGNLVDVIDMDDCIIHWSNKNAVKEFRKNVINEFSNAAKTITDHNDDNDDVRATECWLLGTEVVIENNITKLKTHLELLAKFEKDIKKLKKKYLLKSIDNIIKNKKGD